MTLRHLASMGLGAALLAACAQTVTDSAEQADSALPDASLFDAALLDASPADIAPADIAPADIARPDAPTERDAPDAELPSTRCVSLARPDCVVDALRVSMTVRAMAVDRDGALVLGGLAHDTVIGPPPDLLASVVDNAAVHWVATSPSLAWRAGFNLRSRVPPTFGVSAVLTAADTVVAVNEHDCGNDPTRLTGPCIWSVARGASTNSRAIRYRGRYAPDDTVARSMLVHDGIEASDVTAYITRSVATPTGPRYAQSAVSGLLGGAPPVAVHSDALVGRGILDGWRGGGVDARVLDTADAGVRVVAENLDPGASSPLPRRLDVTLPGDASVAARLAHRGDAWFVLLQSPGRLGCSAVGDGGETLLGDVLVLAGADLTAPLAWSPAGDAFVIDHTGPVRVGGRTFEGPATLVAALDVGCRATVLVDLPHANATASAPSTLAGDGVGVLYVAQNATTADESWCDIRAIAP